MFNQQYFMTVILGVHFRKQTNEKPPYIYIYIYIYIYSSATRIPPTLRIYMYICIQAANDISFNFTQTFRDYKVNKKYIIGLISC